MPALNFQERFAESVELGLLDRFAPGAKLHTIRRIRKHPIEPEDTLYLFTGQRTKRCRKLGITMCEGVEPVVIDIYGVTINDEAWGESAFLQTFVEEDGFRDWPEMRDWFKNVHGLPFEGVLIQW